VSAVNPTNENLTDLAEDSIRGATSLVLGMVTATIVNGIGTILVGRLLGPVLYAQYSLALVLPSLLFSFSIFGIDIALVRYVPKMRAEGNDKEALRTLRVGLLLRLLIVAFVSITGFLLSGLFAEAVLGRPSLAPYIAFSCIAVAFEGLFWVAFFALQSLDKPSWSGFIRIFQASMKAGMSVFLILIGLEMFGAISGFVLSYVVTGVISIALLAKELQKYGEVNFKGRNKTYYTKLIMIFGLPLYAVTIIAAFAIQYRLVLLAAFSSDVDVGNFSVAVNISTLLRAVSAPLFIALLPAFSRVSTLSGDSDISRAFAMAHRYVALVIVPAATIFMIMSQEIILLLYGSEYATASMYLTLFSSVFLLVGLGNGVLTSFFSGVGKNTLTLLFYVVYVVAFLPLGFISTALAGGQGLIAAHFVSTLLACIVGLWKGKQQLHLKYDFLSLGRIYLSSGIAAVMILLLNQLVEMHYVATVIAGFSLFILFYLTLLPLTRAVRDQDIRILDGALGAMRGINLAIGPILKYERMVLSLVNSSAGSDEPLQQNH